jgi:hypothetical protein
MISFAVFLLFGIRLQQPIHCAAAQGHLNVVRALATRGASVLAKENKSCYGFAFSIPFQVTRFFF